MMFRSYFMVLNAFFFISLIGTDISHTGVAFSQLTNDVAFTTHPSLETEPLKVFSLGKIHLKPEFNDIAKELNIKAGEPLKAIPLSMSVSVFEKLDKDSDLDGWQEDNNGQIFVAARFGGNIPSGLSLEACLEIDCFVYNSESSAGYDSNLRSINLIPISVGEIDDASDVDFIVRSETPILDFSSIMTIDVEAEFFLIFKE